MAQRASPVIADDRWQPTTISSRRHAPAESNGCAWRAVQLGSHSDAFCGQSASLEPQEAMAATKRAVATKRFARAVRERMVWRVQHGM